LFRIEHITPKNHERPPQYSGYAPETQWLSGHRAGATASVETVSSVLIEQFRGPVQGSDRNGGCVPK
jgi:hypothetical protein